MTPAPSGARRLLFLMDHSLDFVEFLGGGGVIEGVTGAVKMLGGYDPEELKGTHYQEIIHPDDGPMAADAFARVLRGEPVEAVTLRYRHKDGSWRTVQVNARNFLDDPAVHAVIVLTRDLTDQLNAEESLAAANIELRRLSHQLIVVQERERSRIAGELHDDVQQILVGLRMTMEASAAALVPSIDLVGSWIDLVKRAIEHLHALTRSIRPPAIGAGALAAEIRAHVERLSLADKQDINLEVETNLGPLTPEMELACFRIVQEALSNAIQHSGAKQLGVCVKRSDSNLIVSIRDDGVGFSVSHVRTEALQTGRIGLLSMRERAKLVGGHLEVTSSMGHGTHVRAQFRVA